MKQDIPPEWYYLAKIKDILTILNNVGHNVPQILRKDAKTQYINRN